MVVMGKLLAKELYTYKIRVNSLAPGIIKTNFSKVLWQGKEEKVI